MKTLKCVNIDSTRHIHCNELTTQNCTLQNVTSNSANIFKTRINGTLFLNSTCASIKDSAIEVLIINHRSNNTILPIEIYNSRIGRIEAPHGVLFVFVGDSPLPLEIAGKCFLLRRYINGALKAFPKHALEAAYVREQERSIGIGRRARNRFTRRVKHHKS